MSCLSSGLTLDTLSRSTSGLVDFAIRVVRCIFSLLDRFSAALVDRRVNMTKILS